MALRWKCLEGVSPEDRIIINPADSLENGQTVNVAADNPNPGKVSPS